MLSKNKYRHLFFDLDNTLWDFERNSSESLHELHNEFNLSSLGIHNAEDFSITVRDISLQLWKDFNFGAINKEELRWKRFHYTFSKYGITNTELISNFSEAYIRETPQKKHLFEGVAELLEYLQPKYRLHIITNGFESIQQQKLKASGISDYFETITTSESSSSRKPLPAIFYSALNSAKASLDNSLMIGDDWHADIIGASEIGLDSVFIGNKIHDQGKCLFHLSCASELKFHL